MQKTPYHSEENYTSEDKQKLAKCMEEFDASAVIEAVMGSGNGHGHVTQDFYNKLKDAIGNGKTIKVSGFICTTADTPDYIIFSMTLANRDFTALTCITIFPDLRVEMTEPTVLATESELDEIRNRLTALERKA